MRNLKKILALVLALMMVVSVMVVASAASFNDYDDVDEIDSDYAEAVEVLTNMGVFRGFDGGFTKLHTFEFQNSQGHTESYDVWKSENSNLGNTTVVVK